MTDRFRQIETQLPILFSQIRPCVRTTLDASKAKFEERIIVAMEGYTGEMHACIDSFEGRMSA